MCRMHACIIATVAGLMLAAPTIGQTPNSVQSNARPNGLTPVGLVMRSGSDARALDFNNRILPAAMQIVEAQLREQVVFAGRSAFRLDSDKLFLFRNPVRPIRVYFVFEGAGYHNSVGYGIAKAGRERRSALKLLFPDTSTNLSNRTTWEPVFPGDFMDIREGAAGDQIDFFLISHGAGGGSQILWNDDAFNPDKLQHITAFQLPDPNFLLLGFEDIVGGGDLDYNDCVMVVDFGFDWRSEIELPQ